MRENKVIDILRGTKDPSLRKRAPRYADIAVHVLGPGQDCVVQIGSRVVLEGVTRQRAIEEAEGQRRRLQEKGIRAKVTIYERQP